MKARIGDLVEVVHADNATPAVIVSRGIITQAAKKKTLWPSYEIYFFKESRFAWHFEYELTVISESEDERKRDI
ncbi:MAG TPA: hypothetical protein DEQ32_00580 [Gammaproteobacteria bacterium]|nr:hypothetical protein [Gammaproteobacteria bacterium]|tara:strand:- start:2946 stop:3167 length:222 start_codon:yes stop_codon:yes gene_type:complete